MSTIASFGSQSDVHSPIDFLPPEILGKIFGLIVTSCRNPTSLTYTTWYNSTFNFTFVSRHWRLVALSTPHIWGTLVFHSGKILSVMLKRSKMADLSISVDFFSSLALVKKVINEHTSRITTMTLGLRLLNFLLEELKQRPPSLRLRELRLYLNVSTIGHAQLFPNAILVPDRLRVLETQGYNFAWEPLQSFPCLTDLTLSSTNDKISLPEFITALRGMPALKFLVVRNSLPSEPPDTPVQPVHITKLRQLRVTSTQGSSQISNFLTLITVPATTDIRIRCIARLGRGYAALAKITAFTSSLHSLIRGVHLGNDGPDRHYKSVWVYPTGDGLKIVASRKDLEKDWPEFPFAMDFELTIECGYSPEDTLQKIIPALPRDKILSLKLEIGLSSGTLLKLSEALPRVRHIILVRESMPNFIAVLTLEKQLLPFQKLRCLRLHNARFSSRFHYGLEIRELEHCVGERSQSSAKLEKLIILGCDGIYKHDIQRLRKIVEVEWDGVVKTGPG